MNSGYFKKVELVFDNWECNNLTIDSKDLVEASLGSFHSGTTFNADLYLTKDELNDLEEQMKKGFRPRFVIYPKIKATFACNSSRLMRCNENCKK